MKGFILISIMHNGNVIIVRGPFSAASVVKVILCGRSLNAKAYEKILYHCLQTSKKVFFSKEVFFSTVKAGKTKQDLKLFSIS